VSIETNGVTYRADEITQRRGASFGCMAFLKRFEGVTGTKNCSALKDGKGTGIIEVASDDFLGRRRGWNATSWW